MHRTQWDLCSASSEQTALPSAPSASRSLARIPRVIKVQRAKHLQEGWHGNGGVVVDPPPLQDEGMAHAVQVAYALQVLTSAAGRWKLRRQENRGSVQ